nr:MAG TPA: tail protein [Caudoviricetes sp.]
MAVTIQVKRGSRATLPVLALGEYGLTTDTKELFIGGPEGVNIQIAVLDNGGQIPEEQLPEMDVSQTLAQAELKDPPVDGDGVLVTDSAAGNATKRVLWSRIKAALKGYFDPLYAAKSHTHAWGSITGKPGSFQPAAHTHAAADVSAGTLGGRVLANASAVTTLGTAQVRNIRAGTADLTAGSSSLATGEIYLVYE